MKVWILIILLVLLDGYLIFNTRDPKNLREVKYRYNILRDHIKNNPTQVPEKFYILKTPVLLAARDAGELGYNSNKGYEIGLCIDGSVNDIFHVLLHELSHSTVEEYSHSEQFWKNFSELKDICVSLGIYKKIPERKEFCGQFIQD
jgi:hypothetical protein